MTIRQPSIDYTSREWQNIRDDLLDLVPFFMPEYTDLSVEDPGVLLIELFSIEFHKLHHYIDEMFWNQFIKTTKFREAAVAALALIDYEMHGPVPSSVDLTFSLTSTSGVNTDIPQGTRVASVSPRYIFETDQAVVIPAGSTSVEGVPATQGETQNVSLDVSTGLEFQERLLSPTNIIDGTIRVFVREGSAYEEWTLVDSLVDSGPNDTHVEYNKTAYNLYSLKFGDNANGKIPVAGSNIRVRYRVGGGVSTNVAAGTITSVLSNLGTGINVINPLAATGGENEQSLADAQVQGPRSLRALYRAVSQDDHDTIANDIPGVLKAKAVNVGFNSINIYIVPSGGGLPSSILLSTVEAELEERGMLAVTYDAVAPNYVEISMNVTVYLYDGFYQSDVQTNIEETIQSFFGIDNVDFGNDIKISDIYAALDGTEGVDYVEFTKLSMTPSATLSPWSGDLTFSDITISSTTRSETWEVVFINATDFTVTGSVSGTQLGTGTVDAQYVSDDGEITFTISSGSISNKAGDTASFRTSKYVGTIAIDNNEIPVPPNYVDDDYGFTINYEGGVS